MLKPLWYKLDWSLLVPVLLLLVIGTVMLISTSSIIGLSDYNDPYFFIKRHLIFLGLGGVACFLGIIIPHQLYKRFIGLLFLVTCLLLILTLTPLGVTVGGAQRWLDIGFFRFQPAELFKFVAIVFVSMSLDRAQAYLNQFSKGCLPIVLMLLIPLGFIILQPDLGSTAIILMVLGSLFILSRVPFQHIVILAGIAGAGVCGIILTHSYQMQRIMTFLNPWDDPLGKNYHIIQSLIAIGSGGLFGLGLGESKLKNFYLPLQYSDFIFSIICEEGGFILPTVILILFGMIMVRSLKVARQASTIFGFYLAIGLMLILVLQALLNIGVTIGMLPVTGIPLTFISFGGTSLIMSMFCIGVLINISRLEKDKNG